MAGRPPKPTEEHVLSGTFRADRHGDPTSIPAGGVPVPPPHLKGDALAFWDQIVPGLVDAGIARERDSAELAMMCEWHARYLRFAKSLDGMGPTGKNVMRLTILARMASKTFDQIAARFGLTPSDRAKLRAAPAQQAKGGIETRKRG